MLVNDFLDCPSFLFNYSFRYRWIIVSGKMCVLFWQLWLFCSTLKCPYGQNVFFFGFGISRMHRRVSLKKIFDSVTFSPQNWALKFHAQQKWPGVAKSGSRTGHDVTSGTETLYFSVSLFLHTKSISFWRK